ASYRPFDTSIRELADNILDILAQHAGRPSAESLAREQLQHAGSKLYLKVFSGEVADALQKESGNSYLLLNLSLDVLGIPWELLHDGEQFLCQRFKVGRHLEKTHDELTAAKIRVEGKRTGGSLIVFGDTSGLQPGDEKNVVKKLLERVFYVPFCGSLTAMDLFEELQHDYAIVHYIGHGEYHEGDRTRTGWRCTDGSLLSCSDIEDMPSRATFPLLIFANACDSARSSLPP